MTAVSPALRAAFSSGHGDSGPPRELTTALYTAARACRWSIAPVEWETYPMSFGWTAVQAASHVRALLVVRETNLVALSATVPEYRNLRFVDDSAFADAVIPLATDAHLLSRSMLIAPLTTEDRDYLRSRGPDVAANLTYWRPETVGDVLFNWWD